MKQCSYCGAKTTLTREHLIPRCLIERTPDLKYRYSEAAGKIHGADHIIRDVCKVCNGGVLSSLDRYICTLFDTQLSRVIEEGEEATLTYDWDLLTRWLLKVSFNSARVSGHHPDRLADYRDYMLGQASRPTDIYVFAETLITKTLFTAVQGGAIRISRLARLGTWDHDWFGRTVGIQSHYFHIIVPLAINTTRTIQRAIIREFRESMPEAVLLSPSAKTARIRPPRQSLTESLYPTMLLNEKAFTDAFAKLDPDDA